MGSVITGCSCVRIANLAIRYKKIEGQWGQKVIFIIKYEFGDFKRTEIKLIQVVEKKRKLE